MNTYKADISVTRVGVHTAPRIPWHDPRIRFSSCLHREVFKAADITHARQSAIALVENPKLPEFQKVLDDYFVPCKLLDWNDWSRPYRVLKAKSRSIPAAATLFSSETSNGSSLSSSPKSKRIACPSSILSPIFSETYWIFIGYLLFTTDLPLLNKSRPTL